MKIGIIGLGSIGQRHVRNLAHMGYTDLIALRSKKGAFKSLPDDLKFIKEFDSENDFYKEPLDGIIIANPTSLHEKTALPGLMKGIKTFIEKPIAESIERAGQLRNYADLIIVGYCLRFSEYVRTIKTFIDNGELGKLYKASFYRSYYLPKWHPYADYRLEYTAKKELGGGVIRTLSHEIDLMHYLFGVVDHANGLTDKLSELEIDTDDFCFFSCKMKNGGRVNFELDFLSPDYINRAELIGSKGRLAYDNHDVTFTPMSGQKKIIYSYANDEFEIMYMEQMRDFIQFIETGKSGNCSYHQAEDVLKIIELIDKQ